MSEALSTAVVLDKIFVNLTTDELKLVRSVCRIWADVGATHLGRRTILKTKLIRPYLSDGGPGEISLFFNPKLGRHIEVLGDGNVLSRASGSRTSALQVSNPNAARGDLSLDSPDLVAIPIQLMARIMEALNSNYSKIMMNLFLELVPMVEDTATIVDLKNIKPTGVAPLMTAFSSFDLQKLASVSLHNSEGWPVEMEPELENLPPFPERASLTTLKYLDGPPIPWAKDRGRVFPFRAWLQACINSAPNLKTLQILDNFYPDLSRCRSSLKSLEYDGWPRKLLPSEVPRVSDMHVEGHTIGGDTEDETFDLDRLVEMVGQVAGSIEILRLGSTLSASMLEYVIHSRDCCFDLKASSQPTFSFPNLIRLELAGRQYFELFTKTFLSLEAAAPNLKHVSLSGMYLHRTGIVTIMYDVDSKVEAALKELCSSGPHPRIESLALHFHKNVKTDLIKSLGLGTVFPSLKYLEVTMTNTGGMGRIEEDPALREKIECFNNWSALAEVTFKIRVKGSAKSAIHSLESFTKFAGKKVIILEGGIVPRILEKEKFPKMSRSVAAALQTSKDFTKLTLKHFSMGIFELEILLWVKEACELPIFFEDCECSRDKFPWVSSIQDPIEGITMLGN